MNQYTPRAYDKLPPDVRAEKLATFNAGWDARDAIKMPADLDREKIAVSCAASIIKSVPAPEGMDDDQHKTRIVNAIMAELAKVSS